MPSFELDIELPVRVDYKKTKTKHNTLPPSPAEVTYLKVFLTINRVDVNITDIIPADILDEIYIMCLKD